MEATADDYRRAGRLLLAARATRRDRPEWSSRRVFARDVGLSLQTIADIENGSLGRRKRFEPVSIARMENIVGWAPGSYEAVLAGGDPTLLPDAAKPELPREVWLSIAELQAADLPDRAKEDLLRLVLRYGRPLERDARGRPAWRATS